MTDQLTDNEVIAIFMEIPTAPDDKSFYQIDEDFYAHADRLKYARSWSALMPVWYKFKELKYPVRSSLASGQFYSLFLDYQRQIVKAITHSGPSPSEACKLLAEGIRWYNSINQTVKK